MKIEEIGDVWFVRFASGTDRDEALEKLRRVVKDWSRDGRTSREPIELPTQEDVWLTLEAGMEGSSEPLTFRLVRPHQLAQPSPGAFELMCECVTLAVNFHPQVMLRAFDGPEGWRVITESNFQMFRPLLRAQA